MALNRVFLYQIKPCHSSLQNAWKRLIKRSCINDLHFHDLRHEAISRFIERELTIPESASISGHKAQSMLLRYAHPELSYIRRRRYVVFRYHILEFDTPWD